VRRAQNQLGKDNELRLWDIFKRIMASPQRPQWLLDVRYVPGTEDDLHRATDFIVETCDIGPLYFNCKSSKFYADEFNCKRRSRHVRAIWIDAILAANQVAAEAWVLSHLWIEYQYILKIRRQSVTTSA
jgi:hypothetical protein